MSILEVRNLKKVYGKDYSEVVALNGVSFSVEKGEFIAVVGTSGSGKSTLMHLIGGVDTPTEGSVFVDGVEVYKQKPKEMTLYRRRKVAMIYQAFNLLPMLNVRDNITLPAELDGRKVEEKELLSMLRTMGIEDKEFYYPNQLSGGQQQRVAIARALMTSPAILLADEPTGNLDSKHSADIMEYFRFCNRKFGQTIFIVTHDENIARQTDRIIAIEDGQIISDERICHEKEQGDLR